MKRYHLAILKKRYLELIITGDKAIESRLMRGKCPPFGCIGVGDEVFLKVTSGSVCGKAKVCGVEEMSDLTAEKIERIRQRHNGEILGAEEYWQEKADCKFGVLIWLCDAEAIEPVRIEKKDWRAWVVLKKEKNYGLLDM